MTSNVAILTNVHMLQTKHVFEMFILLCFLSTLKKKFN